MPKERTEAQKRAFQKCLEAREKQLMKKLGVDTPSEQQEPETPPPSPEEPPTAPQVPPTPTAESQRDEDEEIIDVSSLLDEMVGLRQQVGELKNAWAESKAVQLDSLRFV